jgi:hypothetical protein
VGLRGANLKGATLESYRPGYPERGHRNIVADMCTAVAKGRLDDDG